MKHLSFVLVCIAFISYSSFSQEKQEDVKQPVATIVFDSNEFDYGEIEVGSDGLCTFTFTNKGTEPLLLTRVNATCGCTAPSYSKEPIKPGDKGEIKVKYNTNILGPFNKTIVIDSNGSPSRVILRIKGRVIEKNRPENNNS
jgi:hypothetical protein